ncbi:hypothetical protein B296_00056972 [Ensete ventricosum]|uniref:Uncharacterized protein n=1 Tax=Ensete ventricosum TaxID=4639 RepID=A0A426XDA0_ENSVE|nr:hypothetical protein B296_00056972 [Ensete ventricosum]
MAERNPRDTPAGTAAATATAQANVLSSESRSFKMDRRSPEASALRDAVSRKLLEFLGSYSDDVLTVQDFKTAHLIQNFSSTNEIEDSERCKDWCPSNSPSVDVHTDVPREQACGAYDKTEKVAVLDKGHGKIISNNHPGGHDIKEHTTHGSLDQLGRSKRKRHYSGTTCGNTSASLSGSEENFLQDKDTLRMTKASLPVKHECLPRSNELATNEKRTTEMFPEPALSSLRSLSEHKVLHVIVRRSEHIED